ncbi:hypothetical protein BDN72DRAFT_774170, partial [Pluteus cervinus]
MTIRPGYSRCAVAACTIIMMAHASEGLEDVAAARDKIDKEIEALQECIRALRSARNHLAPISCFPSEVLVHVFEYTQDEWTGTGPFPPEFSKWLTVTHVSQNWRCVALSCASLWSTISISQHSYTKGAVEAALERSKLSPLSL